MNILDFYKNYPDEQTCKSAFIERRVSEGVKCNRCQNTNHYWKSGVEQWQCKSCGFRTTIKSGTVMESSKMSFQSWFIAMHLLTSTKKSFSAKEIQRQIGHNRYEPICRACPAVSACLPVGTADRYDRQGQCYTRFAL